MEAERSSSPWLSQAAMLTAILGVVLVGVGWLTRPDSQYGNQPALGLALLALGAGVIAMVVESIASLKSLRRLGLTVALSAATVAAAVALLVWIALQPYGD